MSKGPRRIVGLEFVEALAEWPSAIPKPRAGNSSRGFGIRYERGLAEAVRERFPCALHGQWLRFRDANGWGLAQPDVIVRGKKNTVVLECKLTDTQGARVQLLGLYKPLLARLWGLPVYGVVVVRHLTRDTEPSLVCDTLMAALGRVKTEIPTVHWLGRGPL